MLRRINLQAQFFFGLLVALLLGWIYQSSSANLGTTTVPIPAAVPVYQNLPGGWRVEVRFYKQKPPEVLSVKALEQIRLGSNAGDGDYSIVVLDGNRQELFAQSFQVHFLRTGSSTRLEQRNQTLVVPFFETATEIIIFAPQGEVHYAIPKQ